VDAKKLYGGQGNDTYYLESTGDTITEDLNEGIDTVVVYGTSWVLGDNLENLESITGFGTKVVRVTASTTPSLVVPTATSTVV